MQLKVNYSLFVVMLDWTRMLATVMLLLLLQMSLL